MNNKEFKKFIIETASKIIKADSKKEVSIIKEQVENKDIAITAEHIKILAEDMKKINKKIDLRNPLINPEFFEKVQQDLIKENVEKKSLIKENQNKRWQNLYNVPLDENR